MQYYYLILYMLNVTKSQCLLTNIQYAIQRHYFGALAETYFDNKTREALFWKTGRIII